MLAAQATIAAGNQVLAAAGLPINTPPCPADLTINAVAVKLPALWPDNPNKWFLYCEGKFRLHNISKLATDPNWVDALPLVLLGMRAAVKNDLHCSVAEMVFGEPLRLPGEFFVSSDGDMAADPAFVADLRQKIRLLRPIPPVWHGGESRRSYVSQELSSATHVFVRVGARTTPLQSPYQGPFKVLERREKYFKLDLGNRHDMVSLDRIKPAFMDATDTIEPVPLVTSSGRLVRLPARYRV